MAEPLKPDQKPGFETRDAEPKSLFWISMALAGLILGSVALIYWLQGVYGHHAPQNTESMPLTYSPPNVPLPRLQLDPPLDMMKLRANEDSAMDAYGWVNKDSGIVRVPVHRAMEILVGHGLPVRPDSTAMGWKGGKK